MARHPEVFVRDLSMAQGQKLRRITRTAKDPVKLRRAIVVLMPAQSQAVSDIVELLQADDGYVRDVIHAFNEPGFDALNPKWSEGRPPATTRQKVVALAKTDPHALGLPFSCWSLAKLTAHLAREKITQVGREAIRRILRTENVTFQTTTTWKPSNDPDFVSKMNRVLHLYDKPPAEGRVICYDEFGPLNLIPRKGKAWRPAGKPQRLRATYTRTHGVRHMLAALDLATGRMLYRIRDRKRWGEFLALLKVLRRTYPDQRLYVILDNFSPHKRAEVTAWCAANTTTANSRRPASALTTTKDAPGPDGTATSPSSPPPTCSSPCCDSTQKRDPLQDPPRAATAARYLGRRLSHLPPTRQAVTPQQTPQNLTKYY